MSETKFTVSTSPHIKEKENIPRIMWRVNLVLAPAAIIGVIFFGWPAAVMLALCIGGSVGAEALIQKLVRKKVTVGDGSAFLTGLLLAMCVSPMIVYPSSAVVQHYTPSLGSAIATIFAMNLYVPLLGAFFAIAFVKQMFGGLGSNIWNPALAGRALMLAAYALLVTGVWPNIEKIQYPGQEEVAATTGATIRAERKKLITLSRAGEGPFAPGTAAREADAKVDPAERMKEIDSMVIERKVADPAVKQNRWLWYGRLLIGYRDGSLGETCGLWLIIGGIVLIALRYIDWRTPVFFVGTAVFLGWLLPVRVVGGTSPLWMGGDPLFELLSGGLLLGAFFMATDMVTSPITKRGRVIFGVGCGVVTALIRVYGGYPEGVCYAILLMNTAVPLIDRFIRPRVFGTGLEPSKQT
jgi:electron transport complex protein RnfD